MKKGRSQVEIERSSLRESLQRQENLQMNINKKSTWSKVQRCDQSTPRQKEEQHIYSEQVRAPDHKYKQNSNKEEEAKTLLIQQSQQFDPQQMESSKYARVKFSNHGNTGISGFNLKDYQTIEQNNFKRQSYLKNDPNIQMNTKYRRKRYHSNLIQPVAQEKHKKGVGDNKQIFHISNINFKDASAHYMRAGNKQKLKLDNYSKSCDNKEKIMTKWKIDFRKIINNRKFAINARGLIKPLSVSHQNLISMKMTHLQKKISFNRQRYHSCSVTEITQHNFLSQSQQKQQDNNQRIQTKTGSSNIKCRLYNDIGLKNNRQSCFPQTFKPPNLNMKLLMKKIQALKVGKYEKSQTRRNSKQSQIISKFISQHQILKIGQNKCFNHHFKIKQKKKQCTNLIRNNVRSSFAKNRRQIESNLEQSPVCEHEHSIKQQIRSSSFQRLLQQQPNAQTIFIQDNILVFK